MPLDLIIRPNIPAHDLKVLSRLRQEFDHKLENKEPLTPKEIIALGTNFWEARIHHRQLGAVHHAFDDALRVRIEIMSRFEMR